MTVEPEDETVLTEDELPETGPAIVVKGLVSAFGENVIHKNLDLTVQRGDVQGVVGGSGTGKSVLLNTIIGLKSPDGGTVQVYGQDIQNASRRKWSAVERSWGVMFQHGGLFGALTVLENVGLPLREHTALGDSLIDDIAGWKLAMTGLQRAVGAQYPSE